LGRFKAVHEGHEDIHEDHVGPLLPSEDDRGVAIFCFPMTG
jgi:hypothetical protein